MTKPLVSIIIPTWNTASTTRKCVDTILRYHPSGSVEIIVVDNASTDNTSQHFPPHPHVHYLQNRQNLGYGKACNIGAQHATGKYLLFLNSDMEFIDNQLLQAITYYSQHPQTGIVGPQFVNPDRTAQGSCFRHQGYLNAFLEFWKNIPVYRKYTPTSSQPTAVWAISGGAVLISRPLFHKIGGWNQKYFMYYEDLELCRDVRKNHLQIIYYPQWQLIHRHGLSGRQLASASNQWRRLIKSSLIYHGPLKHYLLNFIIWSGQKWQKLIKPRSS